MSRSNAINTKNDILHRNTTSTTTITPSITKHSSRWDALRNTNDSKDAGNLNCVSYIPTTKSKTTRTTTQFRRTVTNGPPASTASTKTKTTTTTKLPTKLPTNDLLLQYESLQAKCYNDVMKQEVTHQSAIFEMNLMLLLQFIVQHYEILPTKETSTNVVCDILLPTLLSRHTEQQQSGDSTGRITTDSIQCHDDGDDHHPRQKQVQDYSSSKSIQQEIVRVIQILLRHPPHARTMLSFHCIEDGTQNNANDTPGSIVSTSTTTTTTIDAVEGIGPTVLHTSKNKTRVMLWTVLQQCLPITIECFITCIQITKQLATDMDQVHTTKTATMNLDRNSHQRLVARPAPALVPNDIHQLLDLTQTMKWIELLLGKQNVLTNLPNSGKTTTQQKDQQQGEQDRQQQQQQYGLNLLLALLQYKHSNVILSSSVSFIQSLLFPNYYNMYRDRQQYNVSNYEHCSCGWYCNNDLKTSKSNFVHLLHDCSFGSSSIMHQVALQCATLLLQSMPLNLWLNNGGSSTSNNYKPKRLSSFQQTLHEVLEDCFVRVAYCHTKHVAIKHGIDGIINKALELSCFIKAVLTKIPYFTEYQTFSQYDSVDSGSIVDALVDTLMTQSLSTINDTFFTSIISERLRGHVTITGPVPTTCLPVQNWIEKKNRGQRLIEQILSLMIDDVPEQNVVSLLCSLLRSSPDLILVHSRSNECVMLLTNGNPVTSDETNDSSWLLFKKVMQKYYSIHPALVAQCMERLFFGRFNYMKENILDEENNESIPCDESMTFILPIIEYYMQGEQINISDDVQCLATNCVSYLFTDDWNRMKPSLCFRWLVIVQRILENCVTKNCIDTLQANSCRVIGNIVANVYPSTVMKRSNDAFNPNEFKMKVFRSMLQILSQQDYRINVRCMAMFAVGNVSHVLVMTPLTSRNTSFTFLTSNTDLEVILELTELCLQLMSDPNEKLATNAVRTTGFIMGLLLLVCNGPEMGQMFTRRQVLLHGVTKAFVQNIETAVVLPDDKNHTWKQRMAIRKQGWGSCNALSFLVERNVLHELRRRNTVIPEQRLVHVEIIDCLVDVIVNFNTVHDKIVISASVALRSIPELSSFENDQAFGKAIVACNKILFDAQSNNDPILKHPKQLVLEIELLLLKLLSSCTIQILDEALKQNAFVATLTQLFHWMMKQSCSNNVFECFSNAFSVTEIHIDNDVIYQYSNPC